MISSLAMSDMAAGALPARGAQGAWASGGFAAALGRAEGVARKGEAATTRTPDHLWNSRVEEQRELREDPERVARAQKGAEQLVSATFIVPILQQLRESSTAAAPFGPGMYEKRMGPMLDAQIADRIVSAQNLPIVSAVRDRILGRMVDRLPAGGGLTEGSK